MKYAVLTLYTNSVFVSRVTVLCLNQTVKHSYIRRANSKTFSDNLMELHKGNKMFMYRESENFSVI